MSNFESPQGSGDGGGGSDSAGGEAGGKGEVGKKWVGFDPTGLERAAKAARELDKSGTVNIVHVHVHVCIVKYCQSAPTRVTTSFY